MISLIDTDRRQFHDNGLAPFKVKFSSLINKFGSRSDTGSDDLKFYIYSDSLNQMVSLPSFKISNNELTLFEDLSIPCSDELILTVTNEDSHHTLRVPCNNASLGLSL